MQQTAASELPGWCAGAAAPAPPDAHPGRQVEPGPIRVCGARGLHMPMQQLPRRLAGIVPARPVVCVRQDGVLGAQLVAFLLRGSAESVYNLGGGIGARPRQVEPGIPRH